MTYTSLHKTGKKLPRSQKEQLNPLELKEYLLARKKAGIEKAKPKVKAKALAAEKVLVAARRASKIARKKRAMERNKPESKIEHSRYLKMILKPKSWISSSDPDDWNWQ